MIAAPLEPPKLAPRLGLWARIRAYFFAGVVVCAPIGITVYLAWLFITFVDALVIDLIPDRLDPNNYLPVVLPGIGVFVVLATVTLVGALTTNYAGRWTVKAYERVLDMMPVVRSLYSATKQIVETVLANQDTAFREVVLIEYPRREAWSIAFVVGRTAGEVQDLIADDVVNVFMPTTPNPTSGFLLFLPRRDLIPLTMTVEEGIKMVISGGMVTPPDRRPPGSRHPLTGTTDALEVESTGQPEAR